MKFPLVFFRYVGTPPDGGVALGDDADPVGNITPDNVLCAPLRIDRPLNRLAIGYSGPMGATQLACDVWQYEEQPAKEGAGPGYWYKLTSSPITLTVNELTFIGVVGGQPPMAGQSESLNFFIQVADTGSPPDGTYRFAVTGDSGIGDPLFAGP